jgi:hypothetical protein
MFVCAESSLATSRQHRDATVAFVVDMRQGKHGHMGELMTRGAAEWIYDTLWGYLVQAPGVIDRRIFNGNSGGGVTSFATSDDAVVGYLCARSATIVGWVGSTLGSATISDRDRASLYWVPGDRGGAPPRDLIFIRLAEAITAIFVATISVCFVAGVPSVPLSLINRIWSQLRAAIRQDQWIAEQISIQQAQRRAATSGSPLHRTSRTGGGGGSAAPVPPPVGFLALQIAVPMPPASYESLQDRSKIWNDGHMDLLDQVIAIDLSLRRVVRDRHARADLIQRLRRADPYQTTFVFCEEMPELARHRGQGSSALDEPRSIVSIAIPLTGPALAAAYDATAALHDESPFAVTSVATASETDNA